MSKPITHVLLITDESGSMGPLADDVRGGYNTYLQSLANDAEVKYRITAATFAHTYRPACLAATPQDVPRLTPDTYRPAGGTALLDAIGRIITDFERSVPRLAEGDRVLLVVQTDGQENQSREYSVEGIRKMIADREATGRWAAIFMGAGPDTWRQAGGMGFSSSLSYDRTADATQHSYAGLTRTSAAYARGASRSQAAAASGLRVETE